MMLKYFRKPQAALIMAFTFLFVSCTTESATVPLTAERLKQHHETIKAAYAHQSVKDSQVLRSEEEILKEYDDNAAYLNDNGLSKLFESKGINPIVLEQFAFYQEHYEDPKLYEMLIERFDFKKPEDATLLFNFIEIYDQVVKDMGLAAKGRITYSCALAIAGTVAATAGFAFVTGGAGLIVALISKGIATAAIIDACR